MAIKSANPKEIKVYIDGKELKGVVDLNINASPNGLVTGSVTLVVQKMEGSEIYLAGRLKEDE